MWFVHFGAGKVDGGDFMLHRLRSVMVFGCPKYARICICIVQGRSWDAVPQSAVAQAAAFGAALFDAESSAGRRYGPGCLSHAAKGRRNTCCPCKTSHQIASHLVVGLSTRLQGAVQMALWVELL